jgi:hypothetical protein
MSNVIQRSLLSASDEMINKLVRAGYLEPAQCNDADAITVAIARMREDLRGPADNDAPRGICALQKAARINPYRKLDAEI